MPLARPTPRPLRVLPPQAPTRKARPSAAPSGRVFVLEIPFEMRAWANERGALWDAPVKCFVYRGETLPPALEPYRAPAYSWGRFNEDEMNGVVRKASAPERTIELRPHQTEAADAIAAAVRAKRPGFLVADDVGLGKTIETWAAALAMEDVESVLVVCPLAVVAHWRRTIRDMGDGGRRIVVINYDRLKKLFDVPAAIAAKVSAKPSRRRKVRTRKVRTAKGVARYGEACEFDLIVWDESHRLKNPEAARTKLAGKLDQEADFVMWLSATAGQNPSELGYLSPLLGSAVGAKAGGDLERVRKLLFDGPTPNGIRRSPTDIEGWPEINRILMPVALEGEDRALYDKIWGEFRDELGLLLARGSKDPKNGLVARLRFRQKASLLRTGQTVELVRELLEQGRQVAISVAFRETLEILRAALEGEGVAEIHGGMSAGEKETSRLDFQHGRRKVCLYTVEEGISLHQGEYNDVPRANLIHDLRWSAIQMKQVEGRTHRDGRFSQVYWLVGEDTVEEDIAGVVAGRMMSMAAMHGDRSTIEDVERALLSLAA